MKSMELFKVCMDCEGEKIIFATCDDIKYAKKAVERLVNENYENSEEIYIEQEKINLNYIKGWKDGNLETDSFILDLERYNQLLNTASNNNVVVAYNNIDGWFYVVSENCTEDVTDEIVYAWLSKVLNTTVIDVVIDIYKDKVVILCN